MVRCKQTHSPSGARLSKVRPKIIFIAGVEGSGHHGLVPLIRDMNDVIMVAEVCSFKKSTTSCLVTEAYYIAYLSIL